MPLFTMTTMISLHMHTAKECRVARVLPSIKILLHLPFSLSHFGGVKGKLVSNSLNCQFAGKFIVEKGFEKYFSSWICHDEEEEWSWRESKSNDIYRLDCAGTRCLSLDDFDVDIHNFSPLFCSLQSSIATKKLVGCWHLFWLQLSGLCLRTRHETIFILLFNLSVLFAQCQSSSRPITAHWDATVRDGTDGVIGAGTNSRIRKKI